MLMGQIYLNALSGQEERRNEDYIGMDGASDAGSVMDGGHAEGATNWNREDLSDGSDANEDEKKLINNKENYTKTLGSSGTANASTMKTLNKNERKNEVYGAGGVY
ncbi:unnamed protein product [Anisakis simplex]|uniref:Uncharacterized protein n=1 Tax=Anisakis simplex TaxID=6269 RepID=A0A0M3JTT3_ANISI|nr:unnamed protein product [Anisakis simplex]